jgi:hypothetical protein
MTKPKPISSAIIYDGPSMYDGAPIVVILSGMATPSVNDKTGAMVQVTIIRSDVHPSEALKTGADVSICGECPLRYVWNAETRKFERVCYVNVLFQAGALYRAYKLGQLPTLTPTQAGHIANTKGRGIRLGAYGDPAMVQYEIWEELLGASGTMHTAYTHQWAEDGFDSRILWYAMASLDAVNTVDKLTALHPNARWYRLASDYSDIGPDEVKCPSKDASGKRVVQCADCGLCAGMSLKAKSIVIVEND